MDDLLDGASFCRIQEEEAGSAYASDVVVVEAGVVAVVVVAAAAVVVAAAVASASSSAESSAAAYVRQASCRYWGPFPFGWVHEVPSCPCCWPFAFAAVASSFVGVVVAVAGSTLLD